MPGIAVSTVVVSAALASADLGWQVALAAAVLVGFGIAALRAAWDGHEAESIVVQLTGALALLMTAGVVWAQIDQQGGSGFVALLAGIAAAGALTTLGALRTRPWVAGAGLAGILVYVPRFWV